MTPPLGSHEQWLVLRALVLRVPIQFSLAIKGPNARADATRVAAVVRQLHADAVSQLGEAEAEDLVGNTLRYVRDRLTSLFGDAAWQESASREDSLRF
jgi:hypothetical protein